MIDGRTDGDAGRLNLHIFLSSIESETRLFKEARYTLDQSIFARVAVLGLWAAGLETCEVTSHGLEIQRLKVLIRRYGQSRVLTRLPMLRKLVAAMSFGQFAILAILKSWRLRPSHVSCHNVMLLPLAWIVARVNRARLIYVPHELETRRAGVGPGMQRLQGWIERIFIRGASQIVVVCEPIAEWYRRQYGVTDVHVVRNVPEREAVDIRPVPSGDFRTRFGIPDSARIFIYQGLFGKARGTDRLLEIFTRLPHTTAHLVLMGYGEGGDQADIEAFVARHSNIHYQPAVPREWIVSYTSGADIGLLIVENAPLSYRYALPNKFFEYAHAGLPIVVSENFELLSGIIAREDIGWSAPYAEIEAEILSLTTSDLTTQQARAREFARDALWEEDARIYHTVYQP